MARAVSIGAILILLLGCALTERPGMAPLPENALPLGYEEMLTRVRGQAGAAQDAFYLDAWIEVDQAARRLEQSARLLPKSTRIPDALKSKIEAESDLLRQDAVSLGESARTRDAAKVTDAMQRINLRIRGLRPMDR